MFKQLLNKLLAKIGAANLGLRVAETIVRNYSFKVDIPYENWLNNIIAELEAISEDGQITNDESAEFVAFIRTLVPQNIYASMSLRVAETILRNLEYSTNIPYSGWTTDIINELTKASEDGKINNGEVADFIKFIREA